MYQPNPDIIKYEGHTVPHLVNDIHLRDQQIYDLENHLDDLASLKNLNEEDNLRLRGFIQTMQYDYETSVKSRQWEIERLTGRVMFLEEELYNVSRRPQSQFLGQMKESYDPQKLLNLERMMMLKDEELDQLKRQYKALQDRSDVLQNEASSKARSKVIFDQDLKNLPFVVENDDLKKQNGELKRLLEGSNSELNHHKTLLNLANADLEKSKRKLKEYQQIEKLRSEKQEDFKRQQEPIYIKVSEDQNLLDGLLSLIHYVRESICDLIFEIFVRSANQAEQRKTSSTIIFTINVKELQERNVRGFIIVLYLYKKMKQFIKLYFPYYGKLGLSDEITKITLGMVKPKEPCHFRDNVNEWLEQSVALVMQQNKGKQRLEPNKGYFHLFRLLALKYRSKYPIKGDKPLKIDLDVRVRLENKICGALLNIFIDE